MTRPVVVATQYNGVYAGLIEDGASTTDTFLQLTNARQAKHWGTTSFADLRDNGPSIGSNLTDPVDFIILSNVTAVFDLSAEAWAKWEEL